MEGKSTAFRTGLAIFLSILGPDLNRELHKNSRSDVGKPEVLRFYFQNAKEAEECL